MKQLTIHGSIFFLLRKFVAHSLPAGSWDQIIADVELNKTSFELTQSYPLENMDAIITAVSQITGTSVEGLKEGFGEYMVPDLFRMYTHYLLPEWKTYEVLLHTEEVMHGAVRKLNSAAQPPILNVSRVSENLLIIDYHSKRKMGSLAVGMIRGIANYYGESEIVAIESTTSPDAERVQIKVHFTGKVIKAYMG